jgi:hypothetical protein
MLDFGSVAHWLTDMIRIASHSVVALFAVRLLCLVLTEWIIWLLFGG